MSPKLPRPGLRLVERIDAAESELNAHEERLRALELGMQGIQEGQKKTLDATRRVEAAVTAIVPEVLELRSNSRAAKVVKKSGAAGLLLVLGGILEQYGPDLIRLLTR